MGDAASRSFTQPAPRIWNASDIYNADRLIFHDKYRSFPWQSIMYSISLPSRLHHFLLVACLVLPILALVPTSIVTTPLLPHITLEFPVLTHGDGASATHLVPLHVGEPPQTVYVLPDTGSRATWVYCRAYPRRRHHYAHVSSSSSAAATRGVFGFTESATFLPLGCLSRHCKNAGGCMPPRGWCRYTHKYADGTSAGGRWAMETLRVDTNRGMEIKLRDVMIGCSSPWLSDVEGVDGIFGLSPVYPSFAGTLAKQLGGVFSYHISASGDEDMLIFGNTTRPSFRRNPMRYTALHLDDGRRFFYVKIAGVLIDDVQLDVPTPDTWAFDESTGAGGVVVDTGTTLTYLPEAAYREILNAYLEHLMEYDGLIRVTDEGGMCFDSKEDPTFKWSGLPRLAVEFEGGARLAPPWESVFYQEEEEDEGTRCLGVMKGGRDGLIIGSLFQRNYFWEYDLKLTRLGFAAVDV